MVKFAGSGEVLSIWLTVTLFFPICENLVSFASLPTDYAAVTVARGLQGLGGHCPDRAKYSHFIFAAVSEGA
jgi:hypothetical protein